MRFFPPLVHFEMSEIKKERKNEGEERAGKKIKKQSKASTLWINDSLPPAYKPTTIVSLLLLCSTNNSQESLHGINEREVVIFSRYAFWTPPLCKMQREKFEKAVQFLAAAAKVAIVSN